MLFDGIGDMISDLRKTLWGISGKVEKRHWKWNHIIRVGALDQVDI